MQEMGHKQLNVYVVNVIPILSSVIQKLVCVK